MLLAHEATVHLGPACYERTSQPQGNQNAFLNHAWAPESSQDAQAKSAFRAYAIICDLALAKSSLRTGPQRC